MNVATTQWAGATPAAIPEFPACRARPGVSPGRGRGLFAAAHIAENEVIERCCSIPLSSPQCDALEGILPLGDYYFRHPANPDEGLLLLGLISLANHSEAPNARVSFVESGGVGWIAELTALRAIGPGEEITHRYRCDPWFEIG